MVAPTGRTIFTSPKIDITARPILGRLNCRFRGSEIVRLRGQRNCRFRGSGNVHVVNSRTVFSTIPTPQRPTTPTKIAFGFLRKNTLSFPHSFRVIGEIFPQQKCGAKCRKMGKFSGFPQNPHPLLLLLLTLYINHNHSCVRLRTIRRTPHVGNFSRKTEPKNYERMTRTK